MYLHLLAEDIVAQEFTPHQRVVQGLWLIQ